MDEDSDYGLWQPIKNVYDVRVTTYTVPGDPDVPFEEEHIKNLPLDGERSLAEIITDYVNNMLIPKLPVRRKNSGIRNNWKLNMRVFHDEGIRAELVDDRGSIFWKAIIVPRTV